MTTKQETDYLDALQSFYSERLKSGLKKRFKTCAGCSGKKKFITKQGQLIHTCGSSSGECGLKLVINLANYVHYPETIRDHLTIQNKLELNKHSDIFSQKEIDDYQQELEMSEAIFKQATKDYERINKLDERQNLIQSVHKKRMNKKKEQNLLLEKIKEETDIEKKKSLMRDYIIMNQLLFEEYTELNEFCDTINNHIKTQEGEVERDVKETKKEPKRKIGKVLDKNLIPQLQGINKQPKNKQIMNVIVAYRDPGDGSRKEQLDKFKEQMNLIFEDQTDIRIYIVEQESNRDDYGALPELIRQPNSEMAKFNLGILKNIGYSIARKNMKNKQNAYYILSDVDLLPSVGLVEDYLKFPKNPIHLANKGTRYNMDGSDRNFLGGVISINDKDFEKANGYPNNFWGWGGEDNALNNRLKTNKISVEKPNEPVIDLEELSLQDKLAKLKRDKTKEMRKREKLEEDKTNWKQNGLSNLDNLYKVKKKYKVGNIRYIKVELMIE